MSDVYPPDAIKRRFGEWSVNIDDFISKLKAFSQGIDYGLHHEGGTCQHRSGRCVIDWGRTTHIRYCKILTIVTGRDNQILWKPCSLPDRRVIRQCLSLYSRDETAPVQCSCDEGFFCGTRSHGQCSGKSSVSGRIDDDIGVGDERSDVARSTRRLFLTSDLGPRSVIPNHGFDCSHFRSTYLVMACDVSHYVTRCQHVAIH